MKKAGDAAVTAAAAVPARAHHRALQLSTSRARAGTACLRAASRLSPGWAEARAAALRAALPQNWSLERPDQATFTGALLMVLIRCVPAQPVPGSNGNKVAAVADSACCHTGRGGLAEAVAAAQVLQTSRMSTMQATV